jgi:predicted O-methyltransferase YrrM
MTEKIEKIQKYWWHDGHFNENQRNFFIDFLEKNKPKNVLEIGFATGRSCVTSLVSTELVKLISVDINLDYMEAREHANFLTEEFKNLKIIEGDSKKIINSNFFKEEFPDGVDFVFVDGGHTYEDAYSDIVNCYDYINKDGYMIVDDYYSGYPDGCSIVDVNNAVDNFVNERKLQIEKWNKNGKGFAIIKKI